jgi:uncharacterized protein YgbK (DUF1537 family)
MPDKYKLYGTKNQGERVSSVEVGNKVLVLRGEAVELTEKQVESLRERGFDVRKSGSSGGGDKPESSSSSEDSPEETHTTPKS